MKDSIKIKTCQDCFAVNVPHATSCNMCEKSFLEDKPDNAINLLTRKIAVALSIQGSQDLILLNSILHQHIIGLNSVTTVSHRISHHHEGYLKQVNDEMDLIRHKNLMKEINKSGCLTEYSERDESRDHITRSTVYALRGL